MVRNRKNGQRNNTRLFIGFRTSLPHVYQTSGLVRKFAENRLLIKKGVLQQGCREQIQIIVTNTEEYHISYHDSPYFRVMVSPPIYMYLRFTVFTRVTWVIYKMSITTLHHLSKNTKNTK